MQDFGTIQQHLLGELAMSSEENSGGYEQGRAGVTVSHNLWIFHPETVSIFYLIMGRVS